MAFGLGIGLSARRIANAANTISYLQAAEELEWFGGAWNDSAPTTETRGWTEWSPLAAWDDEETTVWA